MKDSLNGHSVNAAFLQEIKESNVELSQTVTRLQKICEEPLRSDIVCSECGGLLQKLRDQLAMQFSLEETYGYVRCPSDMHLILQEKTRQALYQHNLLYVSLVELSERVDNLQYRGTLHRDMPVVVVELKCFMRAIQEHESLEQEMIQYAFGSLAHPS